MRVHDAFRLPRDPVKSETQGDQLPDIVQDDLPNGAVTLVAAPPTSGSPAEPGARPALVQAPLDSKLAEAVQVWASLRDSNDSDALSLFITQYDGTFYAKLAEH